MMVACADVRSLPFADGTFDVVVSNSTLDHFRSRKELIASMRELNRVTRPGGELVLTLDNRANPVVAFRNALPFHWLNRIRVLPYYVGVTCGPRGLRKFARGNELGSARDGRHPSLSALPRNPGLSTLRAARGHQNAEAVSHLAGTL